MHFLRSSMEEYLKALIMLHGPAGLMGKVRAFCTEFTWVGHSDNIEVASPKPAPPRWWKVWNNIIYSLQHNLLQSFLKGLKLNYFIYIYIILLEHEQRMGVWTCELIFVLSRCHVPLPCPVLLGVDPCGPSARGGPNYKVQLLADFVLPDLVLSHELLGWRILSEVCWMQGRKP